MQWLRSCFSWLYNNVTTKNLKGTNAISHTLPFWEWSSWPVEAYLVWGRRWGWKSRYDKCMIKTGRHKASVDHKGGQYEVTFHVFKITEKWSPKQHLCNTLWGQPWATSNQGDEGIGKSYIYNGLGTRDTLKMNLQILFCVYFNTKNSVEKAFKKRIS